MRYLSIKFTLFIILLYGYTYSQNVGIGNESFTPDQSAVLELKSTEQGFLPPRMTTSDRDLIQSPAEGLMIFNITTKCIEYFAYGIWQSFNCAVCPPPNTPIAGIHVPSETQIVWNWNSVIGAEGYKYNTVNDYTTATDNETSTTYTQTGLICGTEYTLYVWAYNACGISSTVQLIVSTSLCPFTCGINTVADIDGNIYNTVLVNTQCWLKQNLKVTKNPSGNSINRYCYNNSTTNCNTHGGLYDWNTMMNGSVMEGTQGICPDGWHIPSNSEWATLSDFVFPQNLCVISNSVTYPGDLLGECNDDFGLSILRAGYYYTDGTPNQYMHGPGWLNASSQEFRRTHLWTSTQIDLSIAITRWTDHANKRGIPGTSNRSKNSRLSVRCIQN